MSDIGKNLTPLAADFLGSIGRRGLKRDFSDFLPAPQKLAPLFKNKPLSNARSAFDQVKDIGVHGKESFIRQTKDFAHMAAHPLDSVGKLWDGAKILAQALTIPEGRAALKNMIGERADYYRTHWGEGLGKFGATLVLNGALNVVLAGAGISMAALIGKSLNPTIAAANTARALQRGMQATRNWASAVPGKVRAAAAARIARITKDLGSDFAKLSGARGTSRAENWFFDKLNIGNTLRNWRGPQLAAVGDEAMFSQTAFASGSESLPGLLEKLQLKKLRTGVGDSSKNGGEKLNLNLPIHDAKIDRYVRKNGYEYQGEQTAIHPYHLQGALDDLAKDETAISEFLRNNKDIKGARRRALSAALKYIDQSRQSIIRNEGLLVRGHPITHAHLLTKLAASSEDDLLKLVQTAHKAVGEHISLQEFRALLTVDDLAVLKGCNMFELDDYARIIFDYRKNGGRGYVDSISVGEVKFYKSLHGGGGYPDYGGING